jgi:DNA repair protein RadC
MKQTATTVTEPVKNRFRGLSPTQLNPEEQQSLMHLALTLLEEKHRPGEALTSPDDTQRYLRLRLAGYQNEVFGCVFLSNRHRVIEVVELFQGTIDGASVHPRVVVQKALACNAAALIIFHNHPSGVCEPSHADEAITRRLREALTLIDVRIIDHLIVTGGASISLAESGLL